MENLKDLLVLEKPVVRPVGKQPANVKAELELTERSAFLFGYKPKLSSAAETWQKAQQTNLFTQLLHNLGLGVYSKDSVVAYQEKIGRFAAKLRKLSPFLYFLGLFIIIGSAFAVFKSETYSCSIFIPLVILGGCLMICSSIYKPSQWQAISISVYRGDIPPKILKTALEVQTEAHKRGAQVNFFVEAFGPKDPFLVAKCAGEDYYLAVWDEPDFKDEH